MKRGAPEGMHPWCMLAALCALAPSVARPDRAGSPPPRLADTGLYSDPATLAVDPRNLPFSPQYPLWSDGATKRRWIRLPPGTVIDASDPDEWDFPVGTRVWKEFTFGRRVETRYLEKVAADRWSIASYVWNEAGTDALRAPEGGMRNVVEVAPGKGHDIPGVADCRACHEGKRLQVLGFSALQLSTDRDPGAAHAEPLVPGMVTLRTLLDRGLLAHAPRAWATRPPRIEARSATERSALGYLHGNCGNCHQGSESVGSLGLDLRQPAGPGAAEPVTRTAVGVPSRFRVPGDVTGETHRIEAGDPGRSAVYFRMASRNPSRQMPPLGTKVADEQGLGRIRAWILELGPAERLSIHEKEEP
jgi:hypothetical protein